MRQDPSPNPMDRPPWDHEFAANLLGATVLIGLTTCDHTGKVIARHQMHGVVTSASLEEGISFDLRGTDDGETYRLPPDTSAFVPAQPGKYTLKGSGDVVVDPDFTAVWTIHRPAPKPSV